MSVSQGFIYEYLPWNFITKFYEGVVLQKDGILQRTFAYRAPDLDSSDAFTINQLAIRVNDFTKRLGSGWAFFLEAQRFYTQDYPRGEFNILAPYLIDRERETAFKAAGKHFESSYYLTFVFKPPVAGVKKMINLFVQSSAEGKGSGIKELVEQFVEESNAFVGLLANDLMLAPLDNEETIAYLHSSVSLNRHPIRFPFTSICLDRLLPDMNIVNSLMLKLNDYFMPIIGVNDFPEATYPTILDTLNRAKIEYRWVTRYICLDKEEGKKVAQKKEKAHRASRKNFLQLLAETTSGQATQSINHGAGIKEGDSIDAGIKIETDIAALGFMTTCVAVWDKNLDMAKAKADLVKNIINSAGFTCKEETFNAFESFKSMMPGSVYSNYRALPVMSNTFSHVVPLSSVWAGMRHNAHAEYVTGVGTPHVICSTSEGTPFFLNINPSDVGHTSVFGPTGGGKSTFLNLIEMQFLKYTNGQVVVFDKGRSCRQPCLAVGGLFYEPAGENIAGVNFQPLRDLETDQDILNAIDFIEACITVNNYEVTPPMRAAIKESLELLKEKPVNARTITSFIQYVNFLDPETKRPVFKDLLIDYLWDGGKYGKIFDARGSSLSLDTRFLALEMESLMNRGPGCIVPALVYLFSYVEKKFDGRLTLLVLDEAWLFLKNEIFADKIAEWLKVLRKKNVFVVFATQDVADVEKSPLKTTIIQQCLTKIYLADPAATTPGLYPVYLAFGLTNAEVNLIASSTMKRDYFYTSPLGRRLFQLDLGPLTLALIGAPDHSLLDKLITDYAQGSSFCVPILLSKGIDFRPLLGPDAPLDKRPVKKLSKPEVPPIAAASLPGDDTAGPEDSTFGSQASLFDAILAIKGRKSSDGGGRAAEQLARQYEVSQTTVYQALKVLRSGNPELIEAMRKKEIPVKTAYKRLKSDQIIDN